MSKLSTITFTFTNEVSAFGFLLAVTDFDQTLSAFDASGTLLESLVIPDQVTNLPFPYSSYHGISSSTANIKSFTLTSTTDVWLMDDLSYVTGATTPVPLPASSALLLGASGAFVAAARRRKTKAKH